METELHIVGILPQGSIHTGSLYSSSSRTHAGSGEGVLVSVCSSGRLVALVSPSYNAQFITGEIDSEGKSEGTPSFVYNNAFQGILDIAREPMSTKPRPQATAVLVLPIAFNIQPGKVQRSSVVLVGFSDGYVRGYSKSGQRVMTQQLHTKEVRRLTCMAASTDQKNSPSQCNVVVTYPGLVCVIDGGSLVSVIKTYVQNRSSDGEGDAVRLSYKKWKLLDQTSTADVALLGHSTPSAFDHLCEASCVGGFEATLRSTPSPEAQLITVGESPMIALYKITKDAGHLNMSEVVHAVASKMTSAVLGKISQASGWLSWGKSSSSSSPKPPVNKEKFQLSTNLPMSTNIPDSRRSILSITVSPQSNMVALVDCFGRVLLLECEGLVVRRMWKGYRDAQCGWLLVHDSPSSGRPERGKRKRSSQPSPSPHHTKKAQCLCIYAPRRGIVELWPVQTGTRVAVFQVGKGCQLLYSPHGIFTFDLEEEGDIARKEKGVVHEKGIQETVLLLCPNGQLVTFGVPFPLLTRLGDPSSFDAHLMKKLPQAIQAGDSNLLVDVFSGIKSSQGMKQAVDILIGAQQTQSVSYDLIVKLLGIALERINGSDPATFPLYLYVGGVKQGAELLQGVEELVSITSDTPSSSKLEESLCTLCELPSDRATTISSCLSSYFSGLSQRKTVIRNIDLKAFIKCFELPTKVGNVLLTPTKPAVGEDGDKLTRSLSRTYSTYPVRLTLKESLVNATLLDIGSSLFMKLLTADMADYSLSTLFQSCGLAASDLLSLLCGVCVSGVAVEKNPVALLKRLHKLLTLITALRGPEVSLTSSLTRSEVTEVDVWSPVFSLCAQSCKVGHALLVALVCQKFLPAHTEEGMESGDQGWESWEPVSFEKEQWINLTHQLEVLTLVSNLIGRDSLAHLPLAPHAVCEEESGAISLNDLRPLTDSERGVCAESLEEYGPGLIARCVAKWLVTNHIPAEFVARIPSDPHDNSDPKHSRLVFLLSPLLKLLPQTLSHQALLVHCAWQGVHCAMQGVVIEPEVSLDFLTHIKRSKTTQGVVGVLWHYVYETQVVSIIDSLKKGGVVDERRRAILSVCRNLFSWLHRICCHGNEFATEDETVLRDVIPLSNPSGLVPLSELVHRFPTLSPTVVRTYLELLLLAEVSIACASSANLITFFPTWLRGALKKGAYKSAWQEQVPVQLQQKRTKYLCEVVRVYLTSAGPPTVPPTRACLALSQLPPDTTAVNLEVASQKDIVFLLVDLWGLDGDAVRKQWVCAFFAAGLREKGKEVFLDIKNKSRVSQELVAFSGQLCDHLLQRVGNKTKQLALMAQVPPSLLEYLRNQGKRPLLSVCTRLEPTWTCVSQLLSLIQPYVAGKTSLASIQTALTQLVQKSTVES